MSRPHQREGTLPHEYYKHKRTRRRREDKRVISEQLNDTAPLPKSDFYSQSEEYEDMYWEDVENGLFDSVYEPDFSYYDGDYRVDCDFKISDYVSDEDYSSQMQAYEFLAMDFGDTYDEIPDRDIHFTQKVYDRVGLLVLERDAHQTTEDAWRYIRAQRAKEDESRHWMCDPMPHAYMLKLDDFDPPIFPDLLEVYDSYPEVLYEDLPYNFAEHESDALLFEFSATLQESWVADFQITPKDLYLLDGRRIQTKWLRKRRPRKQKRNKYASSRKNGKQRILAS